MTQLDIRAILDHLPHRYPFLLVDRVIELEKNRRIVAIKNVSINEHYFVGHFPHQPVMPGVLQIEALAQAAGILSFQTMNRVSDAESIYYFVGIDNARFKRPVTPGDQLRLEVEILRVTRGVWKYKGTATVDGQVAAEAELMCALRSLPAAGAGAGAPGPVAAPVETPESTS